MRLQRTKEKGSDLPHLQIFLSVCVSTSFFTTTKNELKNELTYIQLDVTVQDALWYVYVCERERVCERLCVCVYVGVFFLREGLTRVCERQEMCSFKIPSKWTYFYRFEHILRPSTNSKFKHVIMIV
jgi:hypothetical protein